MTSPALQRTITTAMLDWRGIIVQITYERQSHIDHLQIESLDPARCPLPVTPSGYRSHFLNQGDVDHAGGPAAYVETLLDDAAKSGRWASMEIEVRQYALF